MPLLFMLVFGKIYLKILEKKERSMSNEKIKLRDKLWLWGQSPDCHWDKTNPYNLPGHSRMTAAEGCYYFGIPNICRVKMGGEPKPPYDQESEAMRSCKKVVWSLLGACGEPVTDTGDMDEVIRQAKIYGNIVGGVFDDFYTPVRTNHFTPEKLAAIKREMCEKAGRELELWSVAYEWLLTYDGIPNVKEIMNEFDVITFWTWDAKNLCDAEKNIDTIKSWAKGKRIMAGCYFWDYGGAKPLGMDDMKAQVDLYYRLLKEKRIDGIIICSNCVADLNLETSEYMRKWIEIHGDEEL